MAPSQQKTEAKPEATKAATEPSGAVEAPKTEAPKGGPEALAAELAQLRAENERLKRDRAEMMGAMESGARKAAELTGAGTEVSAEASFVNAQGQTVPEKYRGAKQYRVGAACAYREGRHYSDGEIITLVDAVPSRTWTPHVAKKAAVQVAEPETEERPSDLQV
ncbi:MAG: hypothetical protein Q8K32_09340 [Archangium sp.]|nr:hypothetical protein [Archangium sp.]